MTETYLKMRLYIETTYLSGIALLEAPDYVYAFRLEFDGAAKSGSMGAYCDCQRLFGSCIC